MPYRIELKQDQGYILVEHFGEVNGEEVDDIRTEVFGLVARSGISRVLVDARKISNDLSVTESFNITLGHVNVQTPFPKPRACLLVRPDQFENGQFIETVAENRGLPIKSFTDLDAGLEWLLQPSPAGVKRN